MVRSTEESRLEATANDLGGVGHAVDAAVVRQDIVEVTHSRRRSSP
jgi:hypothetical protein